MLSQVPQSHRGSLTQLLFSLPPPFTPCFPRYFMRSERVIQEV